MTVDPRDPGNAIRALRWLALAAVGSGLAACAFGPPAEWPEERPLRALPGFVVERVYGVPRSEQGSWVSLAVDPRGGLIASAEKGGLYRVTPAPVGAPEAATRVEALHLEAGGREIGEVHGLPYANDRTSAAGSDSFYCFATSRFISSSWTKIGMPVSLSAWPCPF